MARRPTRSSNQSGTIIEAPLAVRSMGWTFIAMGAVGGPLFLLASLADPEAPTALLIVFGLLWTAAAIRRGWRMIRLSVSVEGEVLVIRNERHTSTLPIDLIESIQVPRRRSPFGRVVQGVIVAGDSQWVIQATKVVGRSGSEDIMHEQLLTLSRRLRVPIQDANR